MENLKKRIREWNKNEEDMQESYPGGLAQYIQEGGISTAELVEFSATVAVALSGESTFWTLRYADKNPSSVGVDQYEDYCNFDLYSLCNELRSLPKQT